MRVFHSFFRFFLRFSVSIRCSKSILLLINYFFFPVIIFCSLTPQLHPKTNRILRKKQMNVAKNSKIRPMYEKAPFFVDFRVYLFNVTNKNEVLKGSENILLVEQREKIMEISKAWKIQNHNFFLGVQSISIWN